MKQFTYFLLVAILASFGTTSMVYGTTYVVNPAGTGDFPTIQAAVTAAVNGDVIELTNGTFTGAGNRNLDYLGKAIAIRSQSGIPDSCVLNCAYSGFGFYFHTGEGAGSVLHGIKILQGSSNFGGGIQCTTSPTISNCILLQCEAYVWGWSGLNAYGGGIYCSGGAPTFSNCLIQSCQAYADDFDGNPCVGFGGGAYLTASNAIFTNCTFLANSSTGTSWGEGGGVYSNGGQPIFDGCNLKQNLANSGYGGGIYRTGSVATFTNCLFTRNRSIYGGAANVSWGRVTMTNCTFAHDTSGSGGAVYLYRDTLTANSCIFWGNSASIGPLFYVAMTPSPITVNYSDVQGGYTGTGNISGNPLFVTGPQGAHYLSQTAAGQPSQSPCVNVGDPASPLVVGTTRTDHVLDAGTVDMGYHFYVAPSTLTLLVPNGGENWMVGETDTIRWSSSNVSENIKIELCRTFPDLPWEILIASTPNNGSYPWPVSGAGTASARVRISGVTHPLVGDTSDANFSIIAPELVITSPNGGEEWVEGTTAVITWTATVQSGTVYIVLNRDYPSGEWESVSDETENDGSFDWLVTGPLTDAARIYIETLTLPIVADESDNNFAIVTGAPVPPSAPDSLVIRYVPTSAVVQLNWSPVTTDINEAPLVIDQYVVYRSMTGDLPWDSLGVPEPPDTTVFFDPTAGEGTFFYHVRAVKD